MVVLKSHHHEGQWLFANRDDAIDSISKTYPDRELTCETNEITVWAPNGRVGEHFTLSDMAVNTSSIILHH